VVQFKQGGRAELHDVRITIYGKDSSRFDRITGNDFEYDPASGDVTANGRVEIDLEGNPEGIEKPDQSAPAETRNSIHLETSGLVFNRNSGNASAAGKVHLQTAQASGSAMGIQYIAKTRTLTMLSAIVIDLTKPQEARLTADHAVVTKEPRQVVLSHPRMAREQQKLSADRATVFLRDDNMVGHVLAEGNVQSELRGRSEAIAKSDRAELLLSGPQNQLREAVLSGNVQLASLGDQPAEADAGRVVLHFAGKQVLQKRTQASGITTARSDAQDVEMTAPAMDFIVADGHRLERAETSGPPQILLTQGANQKTAITAAKFNASFTDRNRLAALHGEPEAKIVSSTPGQPDRVSTSQMLDITFHPAGGIAAIVQQGNLAYVDGTRKAWAQRGSYTTADQMLVLNGSPRVADTGMTTTAQLIHISRATGDAIAEGDVKSTYSEMKAQPEGGMLASSDPIHVTSRSMTAHRSPAVAVYTGNARLWQNANVVEAPTLQFDREHRSLVAQGNAQGIVARGSPGQSVSTVLVEVDKSGKATPVTIISTRLTYNDGERKVALDGGVAAKSADVTMTSRQMNVFLLPRSQVSTGSGSGSPGQVDRIIADGNIVIMQTGRRAAGDRLVYTAADDRFVLTGGPPSIFDAEHGKITGDSLTFFRRDDRVLVEGRETSPTVTTTRVAR
jgi:lipopolysaccharide export system protein LptA